MKILISSDSGLAHYFERLGLSRAFAYSGYQVAMWDIKAKSAHSIFDEYQPDLFIGQAYNLNRAVMKCILARPGLRVALKAGDWGPFYDNWTEEKHKEYPILMASQEEKDNVLRLRDAGSLDFVFIHYHPDYLDQTHGYWAKEGIKVVGLMNAADVFDYTNGKHKDEFASDIAFVGGRWGYKARTIDKYILPLCNPQSILNIKIFGNQPWNIPQYYGNIETKYVKDILASATICPNISEPHSEDFGFDIIERPFKLMSNRCFVISDYVEGLRKLYNEDELVMVKTPDEFFTLVKDYLDNPSKRHSYIEKGYNKTIGKHTYFDRAAQILFNLNLSINKIAEGKQRVVGELKL